MALKDEYHFIILSLAHFYWCSGEVSCHILYFCDDWGTNFMHLFFYDYALYQYDS